MKTQLCSLSWTVLALVSLPWHGGAAPLMVGDPAPKLEVSKWIQGEPVTEFKSDSAYLVEFWATWCGPCRTSIPHLNELQNKYKARGLVVIGQDVWENDQANVAPFVKSMGDQMTYRVALDTVPPKKEAGDGKMAENWMKAAGRRGIPSAFLVDKGGKIAWIGHPSSLKESVIEEVLAGKYDLAKAVTKYKEEQERQPKVEAGWKAMYAHIQKEEWDQAEARMNELEQLFPEEERWSLSVTRFQILLGKKEFKAAEKLAADVSAAHPDDGTVQNEFAWSLVTTKGYDKPDLALAEKIAKRAVTATKEKDAGILDTLARVQFLKGEKHEAIKTQQRAVELSTGSARKRLQKVLDSYQEGKLPAD